jgi:hypothetical protein
MLIQLAVKINKISQSGIINFKNHCIQVMNKRWESFEIEPYILAYWLHPNYRGNSNKILY